MIGMMALLRSGVVAKLLRAMKDDEATLRRDTRPVLLQIRSIIPVLEEGDLWPNRGFYLKVSDRSHAIYVSLPQEQNELILGNKLKIGQFIYVKSLEKADPVPLLRGLEPVPGCRRLCEGSPEDMNSPTTLAKFLHAMDADSFVEEKGVILEKKIKEHSADSRKLSIGLSELDELARSRDGLQQRPKGRSRSLSASKTRPGMKSRGLHFQRPTSPKDDDDDSDSDSTLSSPSPISKRKSWTHSEILELKEIFDSSVSKNDTKPVLGSRSANVSPVRSSKYDSSDEYSSSTRSRTDLNSTKKLIKGANNVKNLAPKVISEQTSHPVCSLVQDGKGAENAIAWGSLPAILAKLGKEVIRQRDMALIAAADALQEACAADRLLKSLSTYSELNACEGDGLQRHVDKFCHLQDDLARTKLIMQSLTSISPFKTSETDANGFASVKEALDIAVERKKNATSWIKSAVAVDLSTSSRYSRNPTATATPAVATIKTLKKSSRSVKPKGASIIKKQRGIDDAPVSLASDKDNHCEWLRGGSLWAATDLATALQDECRKLFLDFVEKYLDEFESKTSSMQSEKQIAGMMRKVKKVNELLVLIAGKEPNCNLDESEREAYARARDKIYRILLNHVG